MNRLTRSMVWIGIALLATVGLRERAHATAGYSIVDLGTLGGTLSYAYAINNAGQITGEASLAGDWTTHPFLYSSGVMTDLGTLGGTYGRGSAINSLGQVTGDAASCEGQSPFCPNAGHPFLYSNGSMIDIGSGHRGTAGPITDGGETPVPGDLASHCYIYQVTNGTTTDIGAVSGFTYCNPQDINNAGQVVGFASSPSPSYSIHAFLYDGSQMIDLTPAGPGAAFAINDVGEVTGWMLSASGLPHGFIYTGELTDIGTLAGAATTPYAINAVGQVTGIWSTGGTKAFLFNGVMTDLGTLGGTFAQPGGWDHPGLGPQHAINASGQIVGTSTTADEVSHAFLYSGSVMTDLNSLIPPNSGWTLREATAINDNGQIIGWGDINGEQHAFLLTPAAARPVAPTITKTFGAASIPRATNTTLTFTLTNPNATALTGVSFIDPLPDGIVVAAPSGLTGSCGGTVSAKIASSAITVSGGSIAANSSCALSVTVTGVSLGSWTNVTENVTATESGAGGSATASLQVTAPLPNCQGSLVAGYAKQYGDFRSAALALGFSSPDALQDYVRWLCGA